MRQIVASLLVLFVLWSCQKQEEPRQEAPPQEEHHQVFLDLTAIVGKSPEDVEQLLGKPTLTKEVTVGGNHYPRHTYGDSEATIVYVMNKSTWLTIYPTTELPFQKSSLAALGLPVSEPSFTHPLSLMRWTNYQNLREINFFANANGTIRYISVCVTNCP